MESVLIENEMLTVRQAAELLGIGAHTVYRALRSGDLKGFEDTDTSNKKTWRIPQSAIEAYQSAVHEINRERIEITGRFCRRAPLCEMATNLDDNSFIRRILRICDKNPCEFRNWNQEEAFNSRRPLRRERAADRTGRNYKITIEEL